MSKPTNLNPLIDDNLHETISNCSDVVSYMTFYSDNVAGEPNDDIVNGRQLIAHGVIGALKYAAERAQEMRQHNRDLALAAGKIAG